ncbi:hypothetical protein B0H19DRAFT_1079566 [Mycena capillaripes]|nr:hypothetical protein B0H19DRAFT_1079566 [Mycena capillaripes]
MYSLDKTVAIGRSRSAIIHHPSVIIIFFLPPPPSSSSRPRLSLQIHHRFFLDLFILRLRIWSRFRTCEYIERHSLAGGTRHPTHYRTALKLAEVPIGGVFIPVPSSCSTHCKRAAEDNAVNTRSCLLALFLDNTTRLCKRGSSPLSDPPAYDSVMHDGSGFNPAIEDQSNLKRALKMQREDDSEDEDRRGNCPSGTANVGVTVRRSTRRRKQVLYGTSLTGSKACLGYPTGPFVIHGAVHWGFHLMVKWETAIQILKQGSIRPYSDIKMQVHSPTLGYQNTGSHEGDIYPEWGVPCIFYQQWGIPSIFYQEWDIPFKSGTSHSRVGRPIHFLSEWDIPSIFYWSGTSHPFSIENGMSHPFSSKSGTSRPFSSKSGTSHLFSIKNGTSHPLHLWMVLWPDWIERFFLYNFGSDSIFGLFGIGNLPGRHISVLGHYAFGPKWKFLVFALSWAQIDRADETGITSWAGETV